jgi:sugar transferase (PEP-CTERM/EpsH1 system associated)
MNARPEVLFLAHRIPYPPDKGDKIRSWRILEALARRFDTHLAAFVDDPDDFQHRSFLEGVCASVVLCPLTPSAARFRSAFGLLADEPLSFAYYRDRAMAKAVARLRSRPLAAEIVFSSAMAPYVSAPAGRPRLIDLCDADSEKWRQYAADTRGPMRFVYAREARTLAAQETRMIDWADAAFAASAAEADVLNKRGGAKQALWFGNGVDADYFSPDAGAPRPPQVADVVFVGAMDYRANVDAVTWFVNEVWPLVRAGAPDAKFTIVGARPALQVQALAEKSGVFVTGRVPDVRPFLRHARAVVAPLRVARGVQNKVLEAMAAGRPVVATSAAAEGVDVEPDQHFLRADDSRSFADAVLKLLGDPALVDSLGARARGRMIERHTWPAQMARFEEALDRVLESQGR